MNHDHPHFAVHIPILAFFTSCSIDELDPSYDRPRRLRCLRSLFILIIGQAEMEDVHVCCSSALLLAPFPYVVTVTPSCHLMTFRHACHPIRTPLPPLDVPFHCRTASNTLIHPLLCPSPPPPTHAVLIVYILEPYSILHQSCNSVATPRSQSLSSNTVDHWLT